MSKKKSGVLILAVLVIAVIFLIIEMEQQFDTHLQIVATKNGDEIQLNQNEAITSSSSQEFDENYIVKTEMTQDKNKKTHGFEFLKDAQNLRHFYQISMDKENDPGAKYDEIYQWETLVYKDFEAKKLVLDYNGGKVLKIADRGYMELSIFKEQPVRKKIYEVNNRYRIVSSKVNGRDAKVAEYGDFILNSERKSYEAVLYDFDSYGNDALLIAYNIDRDSFIAMLEELAGGDTCSQIEFGGSQDGVASNKAAVKQAKKEIDLITFAERIVYRKVKDQLKGKSPDNFYISGSTNKKNDVKNQDNAKYNICCEYYLKGETLQKWYMLIEENSKGELVEKAEPMIQSKS